LNTTHLVRENKTTRHSKLNDGRGYGRNVNASALPPNGLTRTVRGRQSESASDKRRWTRNQRPLSELYAPRPALNTTHLVRENKTTRHSKLNDGRGYGRNVREAKARNEKGDARVNAAASRRAEERIRNQTSLERYHSQGLRKTLGGSRDCRRYGIGEVTYRQHALSYTISTWR